MREDRKIAMVVKRTTHAQGEEDDLFFWAEKSWQERLIEVKKWNQAIWNFNGNNDPFKIEVVGGKFLKVVTDEDDF